MVCFITPIQTKQYDKTKQMTLSRNTTHKTQRHQTTTTRLGGQATPHSNTQMHRNNRNQVSQEAGPIFVQPIESTRRSWE